MATASEPSSGREAKDVLRQALAQITEALQRDWNRLGADAFVFEVLDTLKPPDDQPDYDPTEDLAVLEVLWLERLQPYAEGGYMRRPAAQP